LLALDVATARLVAAFLVSLCPPRDPCLGCSGLVALVLCVSPPPCGGRVVPFCLLRYPRRFCRWPFRYCAQRLSVPVAAYVFVACGWPVGLSRGSRSSGGLRSASSPEAPLVSLVALVCLLQPAGSQLIRWCSCLYSPSGASLCSRCSYVFGRGVPLYRVGVLLHAGR